MGGSGSGSWYRWGTKNTVEGCRSLDANRWMREGILAEGVHRRGCWAWWDGETGERVSSIGFEVNTTNPNESWVRLFYTLTETRGRLDYRVQLQTTYPHFGGLRWWFTCPLVKNAQPCRRRCAKLYLPPAGEYFGCRVCYDLAYTSQREDLASRLQRRAWKIRRRLGGRRGFAYPFPPKPKGMHWSTYHRLELEDEMLDEQSLVAAVERFGVLRF